MSATVHASVVLIGRRAALIRGPSGVGKSRLALALLGAAKRGELAFARLVGDDRVHLEASHGRLLARPADALAGLLEVRGLGILRVPFEPAAVVGCAVDLAQADADRLPAAAQRSVEIEGVMLPRMALPACADPLVVLLAFLQGETA